MNRRTFIKLLSASAMVPVIGLPAVAPGAPAVEFTRDELAKIAEECLEELEEKEPFSEYFLGPKYPVGIPRWLWKPCKPYGSIAL